MAASEMDGLKFRGEGDQAMGEKMMEVAMALMRKVDDTLARMDDRQERMEKKLDEIGKERMAEAREAGENTARIEALQEFRDAHVDDHKWMWRAIVGAFVASAVAALFAWKGMR
jgi:hypothetical protein